MRTTRQPGRSGPQAPKDEKERGEQGPRRAGDDGASCAIHPSMSCSVSLAAVPSAWGGHPFLQGQARKNAVGK